MTAGIGNRLYDLMDLGNVRWMARLNEGYGNFFGSNCDYDWIDGASHGILHSGNRETKLAVEFERQTTHNRFELRIHRDRSSDSGNRDCERDILITTGSLLHYFSYKFA